MEAELKCTWVAPSLAPPPPPPLLLSTSFSSHLPSSSPTNPSTSSSPYPPLLSSPPPPPSLLPPPPLPTPPTLPLHLLLLLQTFMQTHTLINSIKEVEEQKFTFADSQRGEEQPSVAEGGMIWPWDRCSLHVLLLLGLDYAAAADIWPRHSSILSWTELQEHDWLEWMVTFTWAAVNVWKYKELL